MSSLLKESSQEEYSDLSFSNSKKTENSYRIKPFKVNLEYKNLTKSINTFKDYIKKGNKNIQKKSYISPNKILNNESQNNSEISTSFSTFDILSKNELIYLKNQTNKIKNDIDKIIENENKTNRKISELEKKLIELKLEKIDINKELENYLSNKESLEEILKNTINEINKCSLKSLLNNVKISINDIQLSNKKNFYNDLISLLENLNIKIQNKTKIKMTDILNKIYNEIEDKNYLIKNANKVINNFFNPINELFQNILNDKIHQENLIYLILKYILKINSINTNIEKDIKFINKEYIEQKNKLKINRENCQKYLLEIARKKNELNDLLSEIEKKKESINKRVFQSFSKKSINEKETNDIETSEKQTMTKSLSANKINISTYKSELDISQISSVNTTCRKNIISFSSNINNSLLKSNNYLSPKINERKNIDIDNNNLNDSKIFNDNYKLNESFCYFRLIQIKEKIFDPLKHYEISPEKFGYLQGFIFINFERTLLELKPKINENDINIKNNFLEETLKIDLKRINNIICDMNNIINIHQSYLKYNNGIKNKNEKNNNLNINKFINLRENRKIKMTDNEKIKSALCHFFSFSIIFNNIKRIECIFINYEDFIKWYQRILIIVDNNKKQKICESSRDKLFHKPFKIIRRTQSVNSNTKRRLNFK